MENIVQKEFLVSGTTLRRFQHIGIEEGKSIV